jgi:hypothetical protein
MYSENFTGGTTFTATGLSPGVSYEFAIASINSVGTSVNFSSSITMTTTLCLVNHDTTFAQAPINYIIGTDAISFGIPAYTTSGCIET